MNTLALLKKPNLRRLLTANFLSGIGDWFNSVAVLSLLLEVTGTAMAVGITLALRTLPHLIFGPLGGILADRFNRKTVMIVCDLARAAIALTFLLISSADEIWIVYGATFLLVMFSSLYNPSRYSILPQIVRREELAAANALDQTIYGTVMAVGSLIGGVFVAMWGNELAFACNSISFLLSAWLLIRLTVPIQVDQEKAAPVGEQSANKEAVSYRELLRMIMRSPMVLAILLMTTMWPIGGGFFNVLISVYAFQVFDAGKWGIGLLYGAIGGGFIVGGLIAEFFHKRPYAVAALSLAIEGLAFTLTSFSPTLYMTALFYALSTVAGGMGNACLRTLLMEHVHARNHGRVFALDETLSNVLLGLSMLAGGWILAFGEPRVVGFAAGAFVTITSLLLGRIIWKEGQKFKKKTTRCEIAGVVESNALD